MTNKNEIVLYDAKYNKTPTLNVWFVFPAIYSFAMSSLGYLSIFKNIDKSPNYNVERIYTDTTATKIPIQNLDLMGFSCSFEIDFLSIFKILERYNIPLKSSDRENFKPLIFAGGPVLTANPEPFSDFFDFVLIGDGENIVSDVLPIVEKNKNLPKIELLKLLSKIDGIYVPALKDEKTKIKSSRIELEEGLATPILTEKSYFSNTYVIEVVRGCPMKCGFCLASYLTIPTRFIPYKKIIEHIETGLKHTNKIAFLGALITAHPDFDKICDYVNSKIDEGINVELSVSSLRADMTSPKPIQTLVRCGQKHATIAIEAGSDRLRKTINKNLTEVQILNTVKIAHDNGLKGLKVYTMIGLPTETQEDIEAIVNLAKKIKKEFKNFDLTLSFSTFIPKAQTPFEFCGRDEAKSLEKKYNYLKKHLSKVGVKARCSSPAWDYVQAIISRGDRSISEFLIHSYEFGCNLGAFRKAQKLFEKKYGKDYLNNLAQSPLPLDVKLPWDFIATNTPKDLLISEYNRLLN